MHLGIGRFNGQNQLNSGGKFDGCLNAEADGEQINNNINNQTGMNGQPTDAPM